MSGDRVSHATHVSRSDSGGFYWWCDDGCGSGDYAERIDARAAANEHEARYADPTPPPETP